MSNLAPCTPPPAELRLGTLPLVACARYSARLAAGPRDLRRAQRLRHSAFIEAAGLQARPGRLDRDRFDPLCRHLLIEERESGALAGCLRLRSFAQGAALADSYAAQHYDLCALCRRPGRMAEVGRFCLRPGLGDGQAIRLAWAALTRLVEAEGIGFLFGCASFAGTDPGPHAAAFALLRAEYLAPAAWRPVARAAAGERRRDLVRFAALPAPAVVAAAPSHAEPQPRGPSAAFPLPPLLRSYLALGARVSDHAVRDRELNTLHVFIGLETARVPASRVRALRAAAG